MVGRERDHQFGSPCYWSRGGTVGLADQVWPMASLCRDRVRLLGDASQKWNKRAGDLVGNVICPYQWIRAAMDLVGGSFCVAGW